MDKRQGGFLGENLAEQYLRKNHYRFIWRNYRKKWGEIDLVVYDKKTKETVFVEVKMTSASDLSLILPEDHLTDKKIERLKKAILSFLSKYDLDDKPWRLDFIAIEAQKHQKPIIRHYQNLSVEF